VQIGKPESTSGNELVKYQELQKDASTAERIQDGIASDKIETGQVAREGEGLVQISQEARSRVELEEAIQMARKAYQDLDGIRQDRVELARERLESGYYERQEVLEGLAQKLKGALNF
jgi:hypothetical protein